MVGDLIRMGVLERHEDPADRRRRIVNVTDAKRPAIQGRLARGAAAWRKALAPLSSSERQLFVHTLRAYEAAMVESLT